jgi:hypothetical protein
MATFITTAHFRIARTWPTRTNTASKETRRISAGKTRKDSLAKMFRCDFWDPSWANDFLCKDMLDKFRYWKHLSCYGVYSDVNVPVSLQSGITAPWVLHRQRSTSLRTVLVNSSINEGISIAFRRTFYYQFKGLGTPSTWRQLKCSTAIWTAVHRARVSASASAWRNKTTSTPCLPARLSTSRSTSTNERSVGPKQHLSHNKHATIRQFRGQEVTYKALLSGRSLTCHSLNWRTSGRAWHRNAVPLDLPEFVHSLRFVWGKASAFLCRYLTLSD